MWTSFGDKYVIIKCTLYRGINIGIRFCMFVFISLCPVLELRVNKAVIRKKKLWAFFVAIFHSFFMLQESAAADWLLNWSLPQSSCESRLFQVGKMDD